MSIKKIHNLGLKEIKRIILEIEKVILNVKYKKGIKSFMEYLQSSKTNRYKNVKEVFEHYEKTRKYLWDIVIT